MARFAHVQSHVRTWHLAKSDEAHLADREDPEDIQPVPDVPEEIQPHVDIEPEPRHGNASTSTENGDNDNEAERGVWSMVTDMQQFLG